MSGPLSIQDLVTVWESTYDSSYVEPLERLGEGKGLEAYTQSFAQLARVSEAIDTTTQSMYLLPSSGQSDDPAAGESRATVTLTVERTKRIDYPIVLKSGDVWFYEQTSDWGEAPGDPAQVVLTGRRYTPDSDFVFLPGASTPSVSAIAVAEQAGYGYNNPMPGSISVIGQPGTGFNNSGASVVVGTNEDYLVCAPIADMIVPDHVGQYLVFTAGANLGAIRRIGGYSPSGVILDRLEYFEGTLSGSGFTTNEVVYQESSGAFGRAIGGTATKLVIVVTSGTFDLYGTAIMGTVTSNSFSATKIIISPTLTAENGTASWHVLDWQTDLGFTATNAASPSGGKIGVLDELGKERGIYRNAGETDTSYRKRVANLPDVVSPGAITRAANRAVTPYGLNACLREVGSAKYPGWFYDAVSDAYSGWYDMDCQVVGGMGIPPFRPGQRVAQINPTTGAIVYGTPVFDFALMGTYTWIFRGIANRTGDFLPGVLIYDPDGTDWFVPGSVQGALDPANTFRVYLDLLESRAFFFLAVPFLPLGEFGFGWDDALVCAYDASPMSNFFDGYPYGTAGIYSTVWKQIEAVRAGGVGWDMLKDDLGCV